jgi:hypothetical protein
VSRACFDSAFCPALLTADAKMHTLLDYSMAAAIGSVVEQHEAPLLGVPPAAAAQPQQAATQGSQPGVRRHKRSNTYPDSRLAKADMTAPYLVAGLQLQLPQAPGDTPATAAAAAAAEASFASEGMVSADGGGTGLSTPASHVSYSGAGGRQLPASVFLECDPGDASGADLLGSSQQERQSSWHYNPAFRESWDLDEQQQQQQLLLVSGQTAAALPGSSGDGASRGSTNSSPFQHVQEVQLQLKGKQQERSAPSSNGSTLIPTYVDRTAQQQAGADAEGAVVDLAPALGAMDAAQQPSSRPASDSGATLAQRRALNIAPLAQAAAAAAAGRAETWRSTLSPVPSASYDNGTSSGLATAASAAPTFGRISSSGAELPPTSSAPGGYGVTPSSRISGFGSQLFSISGRRLKVPTASSVSSSAASDEDGSTSDEGEGDGEVAPAQAQAVQLQGTSYRHLSGASIRQLARSVRRLGGESLLGVWVVSVCCGVCSVDCCGVVCVLL